MPGHVVESTNAVPRIRVPHALIEQVFAGPVDTAAMAALRDGQYSRRRLLLKLLWEASRPEVRPAVEEAWPILVAAEKDAPEVVREILLYPSVGTWLVRVVRKIRGIIDDDQIWDDMGYLGSIAASAAVRGGIDAIATAQVRDGRVTLPTVGQFEVPGQVGKRIRVRVSDSAAFLERGDGSWVSVDETRSIPLRSHRSTADGLSIRWTLDDIDPYRAFDGKAANDRLTASEFTVWCGKLDHAWAILADKHADYLPELMAASPVIVPAPGDGGFVAASSATSFGAIRAAMPETPEAMAETLLHELQHSKLNAFLDLLPLQRPGADRLCYAPWRKDPRPLSGLLHGFYAFVGVTEYWHRQWVSHSDPAAAFHFLHHREQVREAMQALGTPPELTQAGARFLDVAAERLAACGTATVPEQVRTAVAALTATSRLTWRLRNRAPSEAHVARLVDLRSTGGQCPDRHAESVIKTFCRPERESSLPGLLTPGYAVASRQVRPGEREFVDGDTEGARSRFAARIRTDPEDDGAWVGLLLVMDAHRDDKAPAELVSATYRRLAEMSSGPLPDPVRLVEWFVRS
jgi:HEXXH motif-containing protein